MTNFLSHSEEQTKKIARELGSTIKTPACLCLYGNLGSGKTVFAKGLAEAFGIPAKSVKSPTYTYVRHYRAGKIDFYHFDFYRIEAADELMSGDIGEILGKKNAVVVMEWAGHVQNSLPGKRIDISFKYVDSSTRAITINDD